MGRELPACGVPAVPSTQIESWDRTRGRKEQDLSQDGKEPGRFLQVFKAVGACGLGPTAGSTHSSCCGHAGITPLGRDGAWPAEEGGDPVFPRSSTEVTKIINQVY